MQSVCFLTLTFQVEFYLKMSDLPDQRARFDQKIKDLRAAQAKNVKIFTNDVYVEYIQKINEIKCQGYRMTPADFYLVKRFEILQVEKNGIIIERLVKPGTKLRYATFESLFDAIKEVHEDGLKHACRDILNKKLQSMFANITVKQIQAFVDCCEVCQVKKGRMKKGVVVKPIVTSGVNRRCQVDCIDMQSNPDGEFRYIMVYQVSLKSL